MRRITYTNWMSKIFKEITNGRGERVLENPAVQVLGAIFRKMNLDQNTIGAVSERLQNEKEKKDNIVKIIVAVVIISVISLAAKLSGWQERRLYGRESCWRSGG